MKLLCHKFLKCKVRITKIYRKKKKGSFIYSYMHKNILNCNRVNKVNKDIYMFRQDVPNLNHIEMYYISCINVFHYSRMGIESARSSTSLVVSGKMSMHCVWYFFYRKKPRKALRWGRREKKTPRRDEVNGTATEVLIGQGRPLFHYEKSLSQTSQSILHFFQPHSTIRHDSSIDLTSKSIEGVEYRKCQFRILLHSLIEKISFYGYVTFVLVKKTRFEIFSKIVTLRKRSKPALCSLMHPIFSDFFIRRRPTKIFHITKSRFFFHLRKFKVWRIYIYNIISEKRKHKYNTKMNLYFIKKYFYLKITYKINLFKDFRLHLLFPSHYK